MEDNHSTTPVASAAEAAAPMGFAGLMHSPGAPPNLVFGVHADSCGRSLATEIARAVIDHAFDALRLPEIAADVDEPNVASVHILETLGMTLTRHADVAGRPLRFYSFRNESASDSAPPRNPATSSTATRRDNR